jgi:outer membrane protein
MKKNLILSCITLLLVLTAGAALAEDLTGKLGVTGRIGFQVPFDSEAIPPSGTYISNISTDVGFIGGGGFLYGINKNIAAEFDITSSNFSGDGSIGGYDFNVINVSLGAQYRFKEISGFTPYAGAGLDILVNGANRTNGSNLDLDTTLGIHLSGGVDYFIMKNLAVTGEMKLVVAPSVDIMQGGAKVGNFDPSSFNMTFGVRYFIN